MSDPFDTLRAELVRAAARAEVISPRRRWSWVRTRPHGVAAILAALVVCGGGVAAAVSLTASPSQPLSGRVPGRIQPARGTDAISVAGYRYSIRVTPDLSTGSAGWAVWTAYTGPPYGGGLGGGGGGGYPTPTAPIFQGSGVAPWSVPSGARIPGDSVGSVLTGPQVAAVRIGDRTIQTFTSAQLPAGDRAAVFFLSGRGPIPVVGWRPGQPTMSHMRVPEPTPAGRLRWTTFATTALIPVNSAGHTLPATFPPDSGFLRGWSFWQAPSAVTPNIHEPRYHGRIHPRAGACELTQHGLPGLTPEWGSTIQSVPTVRTYVGELFVSCVSTEYYLHGWPMTAAVLLNARHPGAALGPIPGARPLAGRPSMVDFPAGSLSARRVGNAWLVVQGGAGTTQRVQALNALRINRLSLHTPTP
jgi:hypothetical protein